MWFDAAPMPNGGKGDISAVEMDGVIYIPGGYDGALSLLWLYSLWLYSLRLLTMALLTTFP